MCKGTFHFECSIKETTWRRYGTEGKAAAWRCQKCYQKSRDTIPSSKSSDAEEINDIIQNEAERQAVVQTEATMVSSNLLQLELSAFESSTIIKKLPEDMGHLLRELKQHQEKNFEEIKARMAELEKSNIKFQEMLTTKCEEIVSGVVKKLEEEAKQDKKTIKELTERVTELEQYSRRNNIEFRGVKEVEGEDLGNVVISIASKLGVVVSSNDIDTVHRLKKRDRDIEAGRPAGIVCKFVRRSVSDSILAKKRKTITNVQLFNDGEGKVFMSQHLSPYYKELLWMTKMKCKLLDYRYVWWQGKVMVRKEENSPKIPINNHLDLENLN